MGKLIEEAEVRATVNGEEAENVIKELTNKAAQLEKQLNKAKGIGDPKEISRIQKELRETNSELKKTNTQAHQIEMTMKNLSTAKPKELRKVIKQINAEMASNRVARGSKAWKHYNSELQRARAELALIRKESQATVPWIDRMNNSITRWGAAAAGTIATFTGVSMVMSSFNRDRKVKEEAADNLKAITGLDDDSIAWLEAKAEEVSMLMDETGLRVKANSTDIIEAYMLVGSAKPELLQNKEALNDVTIEALRLASAAKMDTKSAVDALAVSLNMFEESADKAQSTTNVLAAGSQAGSANVKSLAASIAKSGVSAFRANISLEELVGSLETLGKREIKNEIAGTGLKKFFLTLQTGADETKPSVVGYQQALQNLYDMNLDEAKLKKMFGEEGFNAAAVLIDNRKEVEYFTQAVTGTNVALEQAAINSDNAAAKSAQAKNKIREAGIELADRLNPTLMAMQIRTANILAAIPGLLDWLKKYAWTISGLTLMIGIWAVATHAAALKQKFLAFWTDKVVASTKRAWALLKAHPGAAIAAGLALIILALQDLHRAENKVGSSADRLKKLNKVLDESAKSVSTEKERYNQLVSTLHDSNASYKARKEALDKIREITPDYHGELTREGKLINDNSDALDAYIKKLEINARIQTAISKLGTAKDTRESYFRKNKDDISRYYVANQDYKRKSAEDPNYSEETAALDNGMSIVAYRAIKRTIHDMNADIDTYQEMITGFKRELDNINNANADDDDKKGGGGKGSASAIKKRADQELLSLKALYASGQITKSEYDQFVYDSTVKSLKEQMALVKEGSQEYIDLENKRLDLYIAQNKRCSKENLKAIEARVKDETSTLELSYAQGAISKAAYEQELFNLQYRAQKARVQAAVDGSQEQADAQVKLTQLENDRKKVLWTQYTETLDTLQKASAKRTAKEVYDIQIKALEEMHRLGILKEKEYQKLLAQAKQMYQKGALDPKETALVKSISDMLKIDGIDETAIMDAANIYLDEINRLETEQGPVDSVGERLLKGSGITDALNQYKAFFKAINAMEEKGVVDHATALDLKTKATAKFLSKVGEVFSAVYNQINAVMSSYNDYVQASADVDIARLENKYDAEIEAAGSNQAKISRIEAKKQKEIATIKSKANDKAMKMEMAQAMASMALGAINAYASAAEVPLIGYILAPIAAASAIAAGMLQIATIKKQHQSEAMGYYTGGFTKRSSNDTDEVGVVHANEFVATATATRNPNVRPLLNLIDQAQKSNTVGSLTSEDVRKVLPGSPVTTYASGGGGSSSGEQKITIEHQGDNQSTEKLANSVDRLADKLENGEIKSTWAMDEFDKEHKRYSKLKNNGKR